MLASLLPSASKETLLMLRSLTQRCNSLALGLLGRERAWTFTCERDVA